MRGAIILPPVRSRRVMFRSSLRCRSPAKDTPRTGTKNIRVYCRLGGGTYFDFNKNGMTIRAERAASLAKCLVKNSVNII